MKNEPVLQDHAVPRFERKDDALAETRAAFAQTSARENRERIAEDIGLSGARAVHEWDELADRVGPQAAATHAAQMYRSQPRVSKPAEPEHDDDNWMADTRRAVQMAKVRAQVKADLPQTMDYLNQIERRHGHLGVIETRKRWNEQLAADPLEALPRVATELAGEMHQRIQMPQLVKLADDYTAKNKISEPEMNVMLRVLSSGEISTGNKADDLRLAHAYARYVTGADIKNDSLNTRDVIAATRASEGLQPFIAGVAVDEFRRTHPDARRGTPTSNRMQALLADARAETLEQAYQMVTGKRA